MSSIHGIVVVVLFLVSAFFSSLGGLRRTLVEAGLLGSLLGGVEERRRGGEEKGRRMGEVEA